MANAITIAVTLNKGDYSVDGDIKAAGKYTLAADNAIQSFSGTVEGLGRFGATMKPNRSALSYRLEADKDTDTNTLLAAALAIKALIETWFAPEQQEEL